MSAFRPTLLACAKTAKWCDRSLWRRPIHVHETVNAVYLSDSRRVLATLIRLLGDFDVAEEALHDAFRAALEQWPRDGVPANPRAWLVSAGRFKAIDGLRRRARFDALDDAGDAADIAVDDRAAWADRRASRTTGCA